MLEKGMLVEGKYRILSEIGRGGMSVVYLAIVERANMTWAVKEVRKDGSNDYNIVKQGLIAEIDALKSVKHSKLPRIVDVIDNEDSFIIVMDYIEGRSLDRILEEKGPQSEENVVKWAIQLCEVLGYLHSRPTPIIYRDMKPSNVMLRPNGDVTIIDFGTAKKYEVAVGETTGLGTAGFAAPEQYGGLGRTDARTDIFALGMTLYTLLTGIDPQKHLVIDTSVRKVNPMISPGLDEIILKCTQREPEKRYKSCAEMMYELEHYKDNDAKGRKKKKLKIASFFTTLLLSAGCLVSGLVFSAQADSKASDDYEEILTHAAMTTDYAEKIRLYEQAINVKNKAGESRAYLELIQAYKANDEDAPVFSDDEAGQLQKLILTNRAALEENPDSYIEICYETGKLYWYYYQDENQMTRAKYAIDWFQIVTSRTDSDYQNYGLATVYQNVGIFYRDYAMNLNEASDSGKYTALITNLTELVNTVAVDESENAVVRLELLEMVRSAMQRYASDFKRDGVSRKTMAELYDRIQEALESVPVVEDESDKAYIKKQSILDMMKRTWSEVETAYSTKGEAE